MTKRLRARGSKQRQRRLVAELRVEAKRDTIQAMPGLFERMANINATKEYGQTALHVAAREGRIDAVRVLLEGGADIDATDENGQTALRYALLCDHWNAVRVLLEGGADAHALNVADERGRTALHSAIRHGSLDAVPVLLERGADIHATEETGLTALHYAVLYGDYSDAVRVLLEGGADVHATDKFGQTALHVAAGEGHIDVVRVLLEGGAEIDATDEYGQTALRYAALRDHWNAARVLLECGASIDATDEDEQTALHFATLCDDHWNATIGMHVLWEGGADLQVSYEYGQTALHVAAGEDKLDVVCALLERGADIDATDENGQTALHVAAGRGNLDVVHALLEGGADIDATDQRGRTALHSTVLYGFSDAVPFVLERGADIHATEENGRTALHTATREGHPDVVRVLLEGGADIDATDENGQTALRYAVLCGHWNAVRVLLEGGADAHALNVADERGRTALHYAAQYSGADAVPVLVERGADLHAKDKDEVTPLSLAIRGGAGKQYECAKALCAAGASWDASCTLDPLSFHRSLTAGIRACVRHWIRQRARDPSATLTEVPIESVKDGKQSVETYLEAIAKTAANDIVRRRKLCVIGASCSGKTSLVRSLQELRTVMVGEERRTLGIDVFGLEWNAADETASDSGKYATTIWDFGGQDVYQGAHSLYFSKRTLYLVFANVEMYSKQLLREEVTAQSDVRLSRWVRDNILSWVQLVLGRQPDAELVVVCSKCDAVDAATVNEVVEDLEHRLKNWATDFVKDHDGAVRQQIQRSVDEFADHKQLQVSVTTQDTVERALRDVRGVVSEKPERAYLMPQLYTQVLEAVRDIRETVATVTSPAERVEKLLVDSDTLVEDLKDKVNGLKSQACCEILRTLHALGDILWFQQERHLVSAGSSTIMLDPRIMLDLVREVVNHELEDRKGEEYDALRTHGELKHSLLSTFPLWKALCEQGPARVLYFKQLLKQFNLAYPVGKQGMMWDADLIVPSYWKTKTQPGTDADGDGASVNTYLNEAVWQYSVPASVSETIFDQFIVQSHDVGYDRLLTSTGVTMSKPSACSASIAYSEGRKLTEDVIVMRVQAVSVDECWSTLAFLVASMESVLAGYPGLGSVRRHVLRKSGKKSSAYDVQRLIKNETCDAATMVAKVKAVLCRPSVGA